MGVHFTPPVHPASIAVAGRTVSASYAPVDDASRVNADSVGAGPWSISIAQASQASDSSGTATQPLIRIWLNQHSSSHASFAAADLPCWVEHGST